MHLLRNSAKATAIVLVLLMASVTVMATVTVKAQLGPHGYLAERGNYAIPLPAGVTANVTYETIPYMSFRPNPVGLGQPILFNLWIQPPLHVSRGFRDYTVTMTKPDGTKVVKAVDTYLADTTAWFEYTVDQVGTWKLKFDFPGGYFPAGNYTLERLGYADVTYGFPSSVYYKPSSTTERELTVQQDIVFAWPGSPLPTDYWTRPVSPENREWWPILGSYPNTGVVGGGPYWPADTNPYSSNYDFYPYVQAPKTAHIVWRRQGDIGGVVGGPMGQWTFFSGGGNPSIVYAGRAYQTLTKVVTATGISLWQCYALRTGQVYWERYPATQVPTIVAYTPLDFEAVPGGTAYPRGMSVDLLYVGGGRHIKYNPWTGSVIWNVSIAPLTTGTFCADPFLLTVYDRGASFGANRYRLINWTVGRGPETGNTEFRILNNITWPWSALGIVDYNAGIAVNTFGTAHPAVGVTYTNRIEAASLKTGLSLWNATTEDLGGEGGFFSGSTRCADHGKFIVLLNDGHFHCWDLYSGRKLWVGELSSCPWGIWGPYSIHSAYGMFYYPQYDGVVARNWTDGKIVWHYKYEAPYPYETPYTGPDGESVYSFRTTEQRIADGIIYAGNDEHTPSEPITRGWKLHAINATTGEGIWNITGSMAAGAVADGYLTAENRYDGYMYVFGKGKSSTTVSAPQTTVTEGVPVLIQGTVTDQSPAQPGTPCISKESMATYMEYLHMQKPIPSGYTVTGVPVQLLAISSEGNVIDIGTVTSDVSGSFKSAWTPPNEGLYTITASFAGDDSYGSSWAETGLSIGPAPTPITFPQAPTPPDYTMTIVGTGIGIVIAVAIAVAIAVLLLRKR